MNIILLNPQYQFPTFKDYQKLEIQRYLQLASNFIPTWLIVLRYDWLQKFKICIDIVVYDQPGKKLRFTIIYLFLSISYNARSSIITQTTEFKGLESCIIIYKSINWSEREVWDIYGIFIHNHTDLRRILTDYGFKSFPLRKDFPVSGFKELKYTNWREFCKYINLELIQASREYDKFNSWIQIKIGIE